MSENWGMFFPYFFPMKQRRIAVWLYRNSRYTNLVDLSKCNVRDGINNEQWMVETIRYNKSTCFKVYVSGTHTVEFSALCRAPFLNNRVV